MDRTFAEKYIKDLVEKAIEYGFEDAEACFMSNSSMEINILKGEVSSYENSTMQGVGFRGKKNGQMGGSFTSDLNDDAMDFMLKNAMENCEVLDDEDEEFIYCDPDNSHLESIQLSGSYDKNTYDKFSQIGLKLEKDILALSDDIKAVDYLSISCGTGPSTSVNSKGLYTYKDSDMITILAEARAEKDGVVKTGSYYWFGRDIDDFDEEKFLKTLKKRVLNKLGASSVKSGEYKIIFSNEAFVSLFDTFIGNFSSYSMQKGLSLLADKEGEVIASDLFTIREEPMYEKALIKFPFDSEGVLTKSKALIDKGVFVKAFYNLKTAHKAGTESTGNGFKGAFSAPVGISATNLIVEPGQKDFDELCDWVGEGIYITDLNGLHAGVNKISGDFSLFCEGYLIKDGKITRPVEQITVADNFYEVLKKIIATGSDIISVPEGKGEYFCPSVVISKMNISGDVNEGET
ncbi:MAG: TldD/PmbA family protein [Clostridiales bacterium]|nr:TldD/PmbA family protein [Clostridiales bacterium]